MDTKDLLAATRNIWGDEKLSLDEIIIRLNVVVGDISRIARDHTEKGEFDEVELKKELGNVIFSMIRWCSDLGYSPEECIELAKRAQYTYKNNSAS